MLLDLDIDVILQILAWLHAKDILSLRRTSKRLHDITYLRIVWHNALANLLAENIPLARVRLGSSIVNIHGDHQDLSSLSAKELEQLVFITWKRAEVWEQRNPVKTGTAAFRARIGRVFLLRFLKLWSSLAGDGRDDGVDEGRYLLSFGYTATPTLCVQVWDVDAVTEGENGSENRGRVVGEWSLNGRLIGVAVDEGNGLREFFSGNGVAANVKGSLVAISARDFTRLEAIVFTFRILAFMPETLDDSALGILKEFPLRGPLNVRAMSGRLVAVQVRAESEGQVFGHGVLKVIDWIRSTEVYAQSPDEAIASEPGISNSGREFAVKLEPSVHGAKRAVLRVHFVHDWVLVFRESVLEFYFLPAALITNRPRTVYPDAFHKWNWQINALTITERMSWLHDRMARYCRLCHGHGSINVPANISDEIKNFDVICSCRYRPLSIVTRFDSYFPWPVNLLHHFVLHVHPPPCNTVNLQAPELPYALPPQITQTVPSTVRLFGHSVLVLGRYGTLVWTDSEASNVEGVQNDTQAYFAEGTGERVAGRRLRLPPPPDHIVASSSDSATSTTTLQEADPSTTEVMPSSVPGQTTQTSVFATRLTEGWYSVALCESRGRIAIGDGEGKIDLWDHF